MCFRATLAMEMSSTSMKAASATTGAMIQGVGPVAAAAPPPGAGAGSAMLSARPDIDGRNHREAEAGDETVGQRLVEHDLHRHPLHHLDEVAGGVLRRQQAEARAGAALDRIDMALEAAL